MRFVNPLTQTLSAVGSNGEEYSKEVYYVPTLLTGVTDESYPSYDVDTTYKNKRKKEKDEEWGEKRR